MDKYKIGEIFDYNGIKLVAIIASNYACEGCYFKGDKRCFIESIFTKCSHVFRKDRKNVIFKEIK